MDRTPSHAYSAGQNSVADLLVASDPALLVSAPALALVAGANESIQDGGAVLSVSFICTIHAAFQDTN